MYLKCNGRAAFTIKGRFFLQSWVTKFFRNPYPLIEIGYKICSFLRLILKGFSTIFCNIFWIRYGYSWRFSAVSGWCKSVAPSHRCDESTQKMFMAEKLPNVDRKLKLAVRSDHGLSDSCGAPQNLTLYFPIIIISQK